uniref:MFS transporter n=1 Tax=Candidatus Fimivicinus sp. TaxID=3056640 RepID=UPI003FF080F6
MADEKKFIPKKEFLSFAAGALGQGMVYGIMSSYISDFYLNILRVTPLFVLFLMLLARVWDAINDPIMGMIADRLNPKHGKFRTYLILTPVPIAILTFLLFFAPDISDTAKMIYAAVTYVAWGMIYTMSDVPFWGLPNAMTPNPAERGNLISISRTTNGVGSALPMAIFMLLGFILPSLGLSGLELEKTKYMTIAIIASVLGNLLFVNVYFHAKERVPIPCPPARDKKQPGALKLLFTCKPMMLVVAMGVLSSGRYMYQAGAIHAARYAFYTGPALEGLTAAAKEAAIQQSISLISTVFAVATAVGMFGTMLLMPKLMKRFSYKSILISTCLIGFVSSMLMFFIGYDHFWACVPFLVLSCIPCGSINVLTYAMVGDCLDYMEWSTGRRETGLGSACQSFVAKLGSAVATSFIVLMYMIVKLDLNTIGVSYTPNPLEMAANVRGGIFMIVSLIPAISLLLCTIPMFFYDLTGKKKEKITQELQKRREEQGMVISE